MATTSETAVVVEGERVDPASFENSCSALDVTGTREQNEKGGYEEIAKVKGLTRKR